jgi:hypothetical protein
VAKKRSLLYLVIPVLYIGVIGLFVYLQFFSVEPFSERIGNLTISGKRTANTFWGKSSLKTIEVRYKGLSFPLSNAQAPMIQTPGGRSQSLALETYNIYPDGLEVIFDGGAKLVFRLGGDLGDWLVLNPDMRTNAAFLLPFDTSRIEVQKGESIPIFTFTSLQERYYLMLPLGSEIDFETGYLYVFSSDSGDRNEIRITTAEGSLDNPYLLWYAERGVLDKAVEYNEVVGKYLDKAYSGWDQERYAMGEGLWTMKDGAAQFSEELGIAWISEALIRGDYNKATAFISAAMDIRIDREPGIELEYRTSPFIGRLTRFKEEYFRRLPGNKRQIERLIRERDPSLFKMDDLIVSALNYNMLSQIDELVSRLVVSLEMETLDFETCLGMLTTYLEVFEWFEEGESYFSRFKEVIFTKIMPRIRVIDNQPWIESEEEGVYDVLQTIRTGSILRGIGESEGKDSLKDLGKSLILSPLSLSDNLGFLPSRLLLDGDRLVEAPGSYIAPETIYEYISESPYIPGAKPLYPVFGPGSWIWTAAVVTDVATDEKRQSFTFLFPRDVSHFIMIQGIRPFESLELKGVESPGDVNYQNFLDSWYYDEETLTLFVKLTQDKEEEQVSINF